jgi:hypothetical protein
MAWRESITAVVNELSQNLDGVLDNDVFLHAVVQATRAAQATHQQENRPKGDKDRRLTLDPYTVGLLRAHRLATEAQCKKLGTKMACDAFVSR